MLHSPSQALSAAAAYEGTRNLDRVRALDRPRRLTTQSGGPGVTVAVLNLNRPDLVVPLLAAVPRIVDGLAAAGYGFELVVGDTGSTDPRTLAALSEPRESVSVITGLTFQFSRSNNEILDGRSAFDRVMLLNNDVLLRHPQPLIDLLHLMDSRPRLGIVGPVLDFRDGSTQHAGVDVIRDGPFRGLPIHGGRRQRRPHARGRSWPALAVTGAALMIRTRLWDELDGLDDAYEREAQDVDLCLRAARLGWEIAVLDCDPLVHEENGTRPKGEESWADRRLFLRRWLSYLEAAHL